MPTIPTHTHTFVIPTATEAEFITGTDDEIAVSPDSVPANLRSIAGLTTAADKMIYTTGADVYAVADLTSFARTILDDANAAAVLSTLGVASAAADMEAAVYDPAGIAEQLVGLTTAQTLTNKTLTSPAINTPTLVLSDANGAAPTTDGEIKFDRTGENLEVGDGAATKLFSHDTGTATLQNKTIDSANNTLTLDLSEGTLTGTLVEFNTALSDGSFASLAGSETLTNKTIAFGSNTLTGVQAQGDVLDDLNSLGAASTDGEMIVATGAGAFAYESGATLRTSIGLGSAAVLDAGTSSGNLKALNADGGFTLAYTSAPTINHDGVYAGTWKTFNRISHVDSTGGRGTGTYTVLSVLHEGVGSGGNGSANADTAAMFEYEQTNWLTTTTVGEFEALHIVGRGGSEGDKSGILLNIKKVEDTTYGVTTVEGQTIWCDSSEVAQRTIKFSIGSHLPSGDYRADGFIIQGLCQAGTINSGVNLLTDGGTGFTYLMQAATALGSGKYLEITGDAHADGSGLLRVGAGGASKPSITFIGDNDSGFFSNGANTIGIATSGTARINITAGLRVGTGLADQGAGTINVSSAYYKSGTQVVGAQGAAVADASGGSTIDAEARTALNALLARLRTHGLIAT